ncbi:carboxypeptidase-like regulatory domain-containing protein [Salinimicrobium sediminilitoris]|uniref:carboxypeptidase-like regulatory domain-containing protein n=1 Tax=Salinimicrobium sediminilitoris TaxID=2876715 RepID=UPI001E294C4E|nr:carboxypeptidase-like regulatory domain-containing protein [Salinimicrobium sediminilitoris]MCC8360541.1 carboxypeptidase-like regulatory domain-containing protein [Salinimicrobium sediminilitoris]
MIKNFPLLIFFLLSLSTVGQERSLLQGKILTPDGEIFSINIVNLTSKTGTTNNSKGEFEIEVVVNDTLLFSSVQFDQREIIITKEVLKKAFLTVLLVEKIDELKEVSISNISLSGNLAKDIEDIPTLTQADIGFPMSDVPPPTSIERKLTTASSGMDLLFNTLNGKIKMLKKAAANEDLSQLVDAGENALPESFFEELLIPKDKIRDFVYFCAEDPDFHTYLPDARRLELVAYYREKAPTYVKEGM